MRSGPHQGRARSTLRNRRDRDPAGAGSVLGELRSRPCSRGSSTGTFAWRSSPPAAAGATPASRSPEPVGSGEQPPRPVRIRSADPVTRDASASGRPPAARQPSREPPPLEPRRSSSPRPPPRHPRSAGRGRGEVTLAVPPAAPLWHAPCLSASSRGRASRTRVVGSPCVYSLPWLDDRRTTVPPKLLARADVPRASWPRSPSSRTPPVPTTIAATAPIQAAGCPMWRDVRRIVKLSLDIRRGPRHKHGRGRAIEMG